MTASVSMRSCARPGGILPGPSGDMETRGWRRAADKTAGEVRQGL